MAGKSKAGWEKEASLKEALEHGLSEKEYQTLVKVLGRNVTILELGICSALFSEHCSYKSSKIHLKTLPTNGKRVVIGPGENAGVVDIGDGDVVVFKVESHNHPTFIEPFQGAATGVGGILRDVFTMGARTVLLMNALRFGEPANPRTPYLLRKAVGGIGFYGNCMGVPTGGGELFFHESFNGNCLVNAFALGVAKREEIFLGKAAGVGNSLLYVGSKTGRDGLHGATMASESFEEDSQEKRPTVQVGDPFQEKLLLEACLEVMKDGAVVGIQDMGAAGLTSSAYEMAERAGTGVRLELDKVPQREEGMNPYEIMLSESQERMLIVVEKGKEQLVIEKFHRWELDAVKIGEVIEGRNVELYWNQKLVSSIRVDLLLSAVPQYRWPEEPPVDFDQKLSFDPFSLPEPLDLEETWLKLISCPNGSSRAPVYSQFDSTVRADTVIHPGSDATVIRVKGSASREKGIAATLDANSVYCGIDPRLGTSHSVIEAYRNISSVGAEPIGISNCLNFGNPEKPQAMWQLAEAIRGHGDAARAIEVPVISGNVSLYNETKGKGILPTPLIALVGLISDVSKCVGAKFKDEGDIIFLLGQTLPSEVGGSFYLSEIHGAEKGALPILDYNKEIHSANFVRELIKSGFIKSCHDVSSGGLAVAFSECCMGDYGCVGAEISLTKIEGRKDGILFSESGSRYIISAPSKFSKQITLLAKERDILISGTGVVGGTKIKISGIAELDLQKAYSRWKDSLFELV